MGLFDVACSVVSSVCSTVGNAISSVCSTIGGAIFNGLGGIASVATSLISPLGLTIPEIIIGIEVISAIVSVVAEMLGLKDEEETPEELGMKAEIAEKKPEDFESVEQYIEYLREEVSIDKKELEELSDEDRAKYLAIGTAITIKGIEEKYKMDMPVDFWQTVADKKMEGEEVNEYIKSCKDSGITNMKDMSDYLNGKSPESGTEKSQVSGAIIDAMKKLEPDLSEEEIAQKFNAMMAG